MSSVEIGLKVNKDIDNPIGWRNVECIPSDEACLVCLGGTGSHEKGIASGYAKKIAKEYVNNINPNIPIYSVKYNFDDTQSNFTTRKLLFLKYGQKELAKEYYEAAVEDDFNPRYIKDLFKKTLEPRISINDGSERISFLDACKNIRKINFITHCHGAYVALKLEEMMQDKMKEIGYNFDERKLIQEQMLVIAHSPACPLGKSKSQFISFMSAMDVIVEKPLSAFGYYLRNKGIDRKCEDYFEPCYFEKRQGNLFLIYEKYNTDFCPQTGVIENKEHAMTFITDKNLNSHGLLMSIISCNIITEGLKNSLLQTEDHFIPLPPIDTLFFKSNIYANELANKIITSMKESGINMRREIFNQVLKFRKETRGR